MKIFALTTCHNRRELTLRALDALLRQTLPTDTELHVCLVDDGSSDGTGRAVRSNFPSVDVLYGSGDLYWAGGMRFGWETCIANLEFDYLLVFNDDIAIHSDALLTLLDAAKDVERTGWTAYAVTGALADPETGETAYGGVIRSSWWHPLRFAKMDPTAAIQDCDTMNMNFALISRIALETIGFLESKFAHGKADYDFGLRLRGCGGRVVLAPGYVGHCQPRLRSELSIQPGLSFPERWRRLTDIKEQSPKERALYFRRHGGVLWALFWAMPYIRACAESGVALFRRSPAPDEKR